MCTGSTDVLFDARHVAASGIGTYTRLYLRHLSAWSREENVTVRILGPEEITKVAPDLEAIPGWAPMYGLREQALLTNVTRRLRPRVYWTPHYPTPIYSRTRCVATVHDVLHATSEDEGGPGGLRGAYARRMIPGSIRRSQAVVAVSEFTKREITRLWPWAEGNVVVSTYGIAEEWFIPPSVRFTTDHPYLLFVGNRKKHKNLRGLLSAFQLVLRGCPDVHLYLVGGGSNKSIDSAVSTEIASLSSRVHILGQLPIEELKAIVADARALVLPSLYEGLGLTPLEAMALGTPVIVSSIPALHENCGDAASYVDPRDVRGWAAAMTIAATRSDENRQKIGARGRSHARERQKMVQPQIAWHSVLDAL